MLIVMPGMEDPDSVVFERIRALGKIDKTHHAKMMFLNQNLEWIADPHRILQPVKMWNEFKRRRLDPS